MAELAKIQSDKVAKVNEERNAKIAALAIAQRELRGEPVITKLLALWGDAIESGDLARGETLQSRAFAVNAWIIGEVAKTARAPRKANGPVDTRKIVVHIGEIAYKFTSKNGPVNFGTLLRDGTWAKAAFYHDGVKKLDKLVSDGVFTSWSFVS
jgi:hypothetical protein